MWFHGYQGCFVRVDIVRFEYKETTDQSLDYLNINCVCTTYFARKVRGTDNHNAGKIDIPLEKMRRKV